MQTDGCISLCPGVISRHLQNCNLKSHTWKGHTSQDLPNWDSRLLFVQDFPELFKTAWRLSAQFSDVYTLSEKAMATHSSTLAWKVPWMEEPGGLQSMGSQRVGHDWATSFSTFMHWRRKWQPTPVFLPGESQGWGSLVGCRLWGRTESAMIEAT